MDALITAGAPLTMSSREIADLCDKRHDHVLRDVEKMLLDLGQTSPQFWGELPDTYGRPQRVAFLPKRETLILISGYSVELRAKIVDRWQQLEATVAAPAALDLRDVRQLAPLALQLAQVVQEQQRELEAARPKIAFADQVAASEDDQTISAVAKVLGLGPRKFFEFLRDAGVLMVNNLPYQHHIDCGRFRVVEVPFTDPSGAKRLRLQARVTGRGVTFLQQRLAKAKEVAHG